MADHLPAASAIVQVTCAHALVEGELRPARVLLDAAELRVLALDEPAPEGAQVEHVELEADEVLAPAPLDLHLHGAGGVAVPLSAAEAGPFDEALDAALRAAGWSHPRLGAPCEVLATLPIPGAGPADLVEHVAAAAAGGAASSRVAGLRLEGGFLSPEMGGIWPAGSFVAPDIALADELLAAADEGSCPLRVVDVAPELDGALELVEHLAGRGVVVSLAHTNATLAQAQEAIDAGARLATHTCNAMRGIHHREPGVVAAVAGDPRVALEVIADAVHLHPGMIRLLRDAARGACEREGVEAERAWRRLVAISDASPLAGLRPGTYEWAGVSVEHDGSALRGPGGTLAGSARLLDAAPATLAATGLSRLETLLALGAAPRAVLDPARAPGLQVGDRAWAAPLATTP